MPSGHQLPGVFFFYDLSPIKARGPAGSPTLLGAQQGTQVPGVLFLYELLPFCMGLCQAPTFSGAEQDASCRVDCSSAAAMRRCCGLQPVTC